MIFSYSRLKLYEECPYKFYLKYILEFKEENTLPLALGKAVHKAIECRINGDDLEKAVMEGWVEAEFHPEVTHEDIADLASRAKVYTNMGETEIKFMLPLDKNNPNSPKIQGFIDVVVDKGTSFIDWKTNRVMYEVMDNKQLAIYAWAISQIYQKENIQILGTLYFLRFRKAKTKMFDRLDMEFARLWALGLANEINLKVSQYNADQQLANTLFPAKPSNNCKHCPFARECIKEFCNY